VVDHPDDVLDRTMLRSLALIAAANQRSLVEELNVAVGSYVLREMATRGEEQILEEALFEVMRIDGVSSG